MAHAVKVGYSPQLQIMPILERKLSIVRSATQRQIEYSHSVMVSLNLNHSPSLGSKAISGPPSQNNFSNKVPHYVCTYTLSFIFEWMEDKMLVLP